MLALLMLPVRPEAERKSSSQEILERLPLLTREVLMEIATIPTKVLRQFLSLHRSEGFGRGMAEALPRPSM